MESQFTELDIMLIEKEVTRKSFADIAFLLDRPVEEINQFILDTSSRLNLIPYQQILDEKKQVRQLVVKPPREKRERKEKEVKKPERKIISRVIERQLDEKRKRSREPHFKTREVDYSQQQSVRVDEKTYIYIKAGEDPTEAKMKYFENLRKNKSRSLEMEKFKGKKKVAE